MDEQAIRYWIEQIEYPISYLDFEWETFAIPPYVNMKAFDVLCFQYSIHIEDEQGQLDHKTFFATGDCRKDFIDHLLQDIPEQGSIMVFNMEGAEKLRLRQLANQYPEYRIQLEQLANRMTLPSKNILKCQFVKKFIKFFLMAKNLKNALMI